jgi:hypothetical protein
MTPPGPNPEQIALLYSAFSPSQIMDSSQHHVASTAEGCRISRDEEIGFVVACGIDRKGQRRVPTLPAAYAICQQLMPRKLATPSRISSL